MLMKVQSTNDGARAEQTPSAAFKAWFGESVVTDTGRPGGRVLVTYNATDAAFAHFSGAEIYLAEVSSTAEEFGDQQIKLAVGNRGTFDPDDPNILH